MNLASPGTGEAALVQRDSGLLVPGHLADQPEHPDAAPDQIARDPDGRRRVVLVKDVRKKFSRLAGEMHRLDVAFVLVCKTTRTVVTKVRDLETGKDVPVAITEPIAGACGEVMLREGEDTDDPGFGCRCSRIHFTIGGV
jgi:hypothetical protein